MGIECDIEVEIERNRAKVSLHSHDSSGTLAGWHVDTVIVIYLRREGGQLFDWLRAREESQSSIDLYL